MLIDKIFERNVIEWNEKNMIFFISNAIILRKIRINVCYTLGRTINFHVQYRNIDLFFL